MQKDTFNKDHIYALFELYDFKTVAKRLQPTLKQYKSLIGYYGYYMRKKYGFETQLYPMRDAIKELDTLYAHKDGADGQALNETLLAHSELTLSYFLFIYKEKNLKPIFETLKERMGYLTDKALSDIFDELLVNAIYTHDTGKSNLNFQHNQMKNDNYQDIQASDDKSHSLTSAIIYIDYYWGKYGAYPCSRKILQKIYDLIIYNAFLISRHHGGVNNYAQFSTRIQEWYEKRATESNREHLLAKPITLPYWENDNGEVTDDNILGFIRCFNANRIRQNKKNQSGKTIINEKWDKHTSTSKQVYVPHVDLSYVAYGKLVHSLLVASDHYATTAYMSGIVTTDIGVIKDGTVWRNAYDQHPLAKAVDQELANIDSWENVSQLESLNQVRTRICAEACTTLDSFTDDVRIAYLEAPTGTGKSHMAVRLALDLLAKKPSQNKVFYIFPFNNLAEQTESSLTDFFKANAELDDRKHIINSTSSIKLLQAEEAEPGLNDKNYSKSTLAYDFGHYEFVLTSHVQFFMSLFGCSGSHNYMLYQYANSIVILDEIQSYTNKLWPEISQILEEIAELYNIRFIIMSASLPPLNDLTHNHTLSAKLLGNPYEYYQHPVIKNRVQFRYELLKEPDMSMGKLIPLMVQQQKTHPRILAEFITKRSALEAYRTLKSLHLTDSMGKPLPIWLLTGDDNKYDQKQVIQAAKTQSEFILVATQTCEAGVDIDCDSGFKNISLLDSEYQFSGRINRHNTSKLPDNPIFLFLLDLPSQVYHKEYRCMADNRITNPIMQTLLENFDFHTYYTNIFRPLKTQMSLEIEKLDTAIKDLNFSSIFSHMQLIHDFYPITIFMDVTLTIDGEEIRGKDVWETYIALQDIKKNLHSDTLTEKKSYAQLRYEEKNLSRLFSYFCYNVADKNYPKAQPKRPFLYIENAEEYFTDGKFDRVKLNESAVEWTAEQKLAIKNYGIWEAMYPETN